MDVDQEDMQFLGIFGIFRETTKLIYAWRRIFTQITLALILPLSFIFLAHIEISHLFLRKITHDEIVLGHTGTTAPKFQKLSDVVSTDKLYFLVFQAAYLIFFIVFSLLSTSAVVYTVASIYTARDLTFKQVMSVVPKVWKRLLLTFLSVFLAFFAFTFVAVCVLTMIIIAIVLIRGPYASGPSIGFIVVFVRILILGGYLYLTVIWQLASVVSVLEDSCGFSAMAKSRALMKGKMVVAAVILISVNFLIGVSQLQLRSRTTSDGSTHWILTISVDEHCYYSG